MKRKLSCAVFVALAAGCGGSQQASTSNVATVDLTRIQANWPKFINYSNQLASDTEAINRAAESAARKQRDLAALQSRFVSMQNEVTDDVRNAAQRVATDRHFKLVVTRQFTGYGGTDITTDVEKLLNITEASPAKSP